MRKAIILGVLGFALAAPAGATARPADVTIVNADPIPVEISNSPTVKLDATENSVKLDGTGNTVKVDPNANTVKIDPNANQTTSNLWSAYGEVTATGSTLKACSNVTLPTGRRLILDTVVVTSYYAVTPPITYLLLLVRKGTNTGRFMNVRIPLGTSANDPVTNTRYGTLHMGMNMQPGSLFDADIGAVYQIQACTTNTNGETAEASFIFSGTRH